MNQLENNRPPTTTQFNIWRKIAGLVFLGFAYWLFLRIGLLLVAKPEGIASIWPASGLALAVLLLRRKQEWPAILAVIFATNVLGNWGGGNMLLVSLGFALANTIESGLCAWTMIYLCKSSIKFERTLDVFALLFVVIFVNGFTASIGAAVPVLAYGSSFLDTFRVWWVADGLGMVLITPLIMTWINSSNIERFKTLRKPFETIVLILALVFFTWLAFGSFTAAETALLRVYLFFPFLIWLAFRFAPRGMTHALLVIAVIAIWGTLNDRGMFAFTSSNQAERLIAVQMFLSIVAFSGLLISTLVAERKLDMEKLMIAEANYRSIFENASVGFFQSSPEGRYLNVNPMLAHIYGFESPADMLAGVNDISTQIHADPSRREEFTRLLAENDQVFEFVNQNHRKDGSLIWTMTNARAVRDPAGKILYYEGFSDDITQQVQISDALRRSEAKFRAVVENSNDGILFGDANAIISYRSPSYERINGFGNDERLGRSGFETIHPDDQQMLRQYWARVIESPDKVIKVEYRIQHKDGSWRWIESTAKNLLNNPDIQQVVVTSRDITERKQAEDALRESEARYRLIAENSADVIWVLDVETQKFKYVSPSVEKLRGYTPEEILIQPMEAALTPESNKLVGELLAMRIPQFLAQKSESASFTDEVDQPRKDGSIVHTEVTTTYVLNDYGKLEIIGVSRDITKRKQAEDALRLSQQRLALYFLQTPLAVIEFGLDGHVLEWNPAAVKIFGYSRDEAIGQHWTFIVPRSIWPNLDGVWESIVNQSGGSRSTNENITRGGRTIFCDWFNTPLIDADGKTIGVASLVMDITERNRAEDALRASEERYRRLTGAITDYIYTVRLEHGHAVETSHGPGCVAVTGYTAEEFKSDPYLWYRMIWPEDRGLMQDEIQNLLAGRDVSPREHRITRKDGQVRWIRDTLSPHFNEKHELVSYDGLIQDITERKLAEEALRESEEHYRRIIDTAYEGIWVVDETYQTTFVNTRMEEMLGYSSKELLGKRVDAFLYETGSVAAQQTNQHLHHIGGQQERRFRRKDGNELWTLVSAKPILDEQNVFKGSFAMFSDITERKQADKLIREKSVQLRLLYEASQQLNRSLDLGVIYQTIYEFLSALVPVDSMVISGFDVETQMITCLAHRIGDGWQDVSEYPPIPLEPEGKGTQSIAIRTGAAVLINDLQAQVRKSQSNYYIDDKSNKVVGVDDVPLEADVMRSALIIPLKLTGSVYGVLQVMSYRLNAYDQNQLNLLESLALPIVFAQQNALLYARVQNELNERKQAEAALQKFAFMANTAPEFMSLVNRQLVYESVNDAYCSARGKPRFEFIGRSLREIWGESLFQERLQPYLERCFAGEIVRYEETFVFSGTDMRNYLVGMYPYRDLPNEQVTHVVVVTSDITEYKQVEAALRQSALNLKKAQHFAHLGSWNWDIKTNHLEWSDEMYKIFDVDKETFTGSLPDVISEAIHPDDRAKVNASNLLVVTEGKPIPLDYRIVRKDGSIRVVWAEAGELVRDETGQPSFLSGTVQDITERKQMEEELRASLAEKEALLKEVHHRVKNNLQIISSLLGMQASSSQNEQVIHALDESTNRVRAMALIHEKLYQSKNLEYIEADEYISELMDYLLSSFSGRTRNISLDLQIAKLTLDINKAIPCGMIINELVSNALKYAFPDQRSGFVRVCLDIQDGKIRLMISDNGVGLPASVDVHHPETLGLELVSILSHQLKASLEVTRLSGTTFTIIFDV